MSAKPQWHLDVETAQRECRETLNKWQELTTRIRTLVEKHEEYVPDAFKSSMLDLLREYVRAANATVARLQIMTQIKCDEMRFHEDDERPE
ncbi:MAG: hypothetical protein WCA19_11710 [Candidatus Acidiferrales bacterium]